MVKVAILNLMPLKEQTEEDYLRLLTAVPEPVEVHWMRLRTHVPKHASPEHMDALYEYFDDLAADTFDGLIVTGAPLEQIPFEEVTYWPELCNIFDWARAHVTSTLYICWASQAALYYFYGIQKYPLPSKMFGIFRQQVVQTASSQELLKDMGREFMMPHSRHTEIRREDIEDCEELTILAESEETGPTIMTARRGRDIFITGHMEYPLDRLDGEYRRDQLRGRTDVGLPVNYYPDDDPQRTPADTWQATTQQFYRNWVSEVISKNRSNVIT